MATAKDRLNPPKPQPENGDSNLALQVRPVIKMGAPQIQVPEIKIPEIKVDAADMAPIAEVLRQLGQAITAIANTQTQMLQAMQTQAQPKVEVTTPPARVTVKNDRPREFYVELAKEDGETVGMRISADSP